MKKVCLAGFWMAQYGLGAAAIYAMYQGIPMIAVPLLAASYFSMILGGKLLGIGDEMQRDANANVPGLVNVLWTITCFFVIAVFALTMAGMNALGGIPIPINGAQALVIYYGCAAFRDVFLARFYFAQHF
jgi:hypothetical protein